jgi:dTDP-4-amino-4,6-dideoxygalactose transaminase
MSECKVPFVDLKAQYLSIKPEIDQAIKDVIDSAVFIGGKTVIDFEQSFAEAYGVKNVISCANGTDSLYIIMKMLGIGSGDEVITVSNSWISSSETISQVGAKPVFIDIHPDYYSMDESLLTAAINSRTKAVIAVHLQGQMCAIDEIKKICDNNSLFLIEDCAQSHFSEYKGIRAGMTGIAGSFSFYPGKNLGAYGDAGSIITNDDSLAEKCRMYARHGAIVNQKHQHKIEGINSRMDSIQAAILLAKLPHIQTWCDQRIEKSKIYSNLLKDCPFITLPVVRPDSKHTFHLFVIRTKRRDELMNYLKLHGIDCAIHYPTILPLLECYGHLGHHRRDFPIASKYQDEILSIPIFPELTESLIEYIAKQILTFFEYESIPNYT